MNRKQTNKQKNEIMIILIIIIIIIIIIQTDITFSIMYIHEVPLNST
jgi:flagellar basal body-associated protein FliL